MTTDVAPLHLAAHPTEQLTQDLASTVEGVLWSYDPIRQTAAPISVTEHDGVVTVSGVVRSTITRDIAGRLAAGVPGVTQVVNALRTDTEIESDVALALAGDPDVAVTTDKLTIKSLLGTVYVGGVIAAPDIADAEAAASRAEALARGVPGVADVVGEVRAVEASDASEVVGTPEDPAEADAGPTAEEEAFQERLAVWRERAAAAKGS